MNAKKKSIVIGAGIAGMAAAIRLRIQGHEVQVLEANDYYGGKLHSFRKGPYRFDFGPSLFTMPQFVEELFLLAGEDMNDFMTYEALESLCKYYYEDGTVFHASSDKSTFIKDAVNILGADGKKLTHYLNHSAKMYHLTAPFFLHKPIQNIKTWLQPSLLKALWASPNFDLTRSMNGANEKRLKNEKLVQLFNRYATYNGSNPYRAPGILNVVPCLEFEYGAFAPTGGMQSISRALYQLATKLGVQFQFQVGVKEIQLKGNTAVGVQTNKGFFPADLVVSNADMHSTYTKLLPSYPAPKRKLNQERSSSALVFYWGVRKSFPELDVHNILFSSNYKEEFDALFNRKTLQEDPTVYINITSKYAPEDAPEDHENWFTMINVPHEDGQNWPQLKEKARKLIVSKINRLLHIDIEALIAVEEITDPKRIESETGSHLGSLYGTSSNNAMAAFLRHKNDGGPEGLYFCGGSVHPGGGIPLCLLSAKITAELIQEKHG